ncbi:MAG: PHB depolymerase family esterase [Variovorax sp.]
MARRRTTATSLSNAWSRAVRFGLAVLSHRSPHTWQPKRKADPAVVARTRRPPVGAGQWIAGVAAGVSGMRRYRLYKPAGIKFSDRLPLMMMLHGCGQDAEGFAACTRMNTLAAREGFLVLYPEQNRIANPKRCWNWFDTSAGRAFGEAALIINAIDQVCALYPVDRTRISVAGLSAGASMAALLVTRHPERFNAVVMHSGIPPGTAHSTVTALAAMHGYRAKRPLATIPAAMTSVWPPLMVIHGRDDRVVAPSNGQAAVNAWADAAGATASGARTVRRGKRYPAQVTDFKRRGATVATLVEVVGLGHAWSGGAASQAFSDALGPDASRMAWAFASKQARMMAA